MERARRLPAGTGPQDLDNVLRLRIARERPLVQTPVPGAPMQERRRHADYYAPEAASERRRGIDWSATLDAVEDAAEAMMSTEHHAKEIEMRGVALAERALAELRTAEERIRVAEEATRAAEARALDAEARLREAEQWLSRIQDAIETRLVPRTDRFNPHAA